MTDNEVETLGRELRAVIGAHFAGVAEVDARIILAAIAETLIGAINTCPADRRAEIVARTIMLIQRGSNVCPLDVLAALLPSDPIGPVSGSA